MPEGSSTRLRINRRPYILYPAVLCHFRRVLFVLPAVVLLSVPLGVPLSVPPGPSVRPAGSLCPSRPGPSVRPVGFPLSVPPGSLCPSRPGPFVRPAESPLSVPSAPLCHSRRFLAGIQGLFLLPLPSGGSVWEKTLDSRLKMSGMTGEASGRTEGPREGRRGVGNNGGTPGRTEGTSAGLCINR